jgi:hypothetical protein
MDAQGEAAYMFWLERMSGLPWWSQRPHWEDLTPDGKQLWIDLVNEGEDAFWDAWIAG